MLDMASVKAVGFDLDECIYPSSPIINDRIRTGLASRILERNAHIGTISDARSLFEERYAVLHSGRKVLAEFGYSSAEASILADEAISQAEILDVLNKDERVANMIQDISGRFVTYLLTSSPERSALKKLEVLGINPDCFKYKGYSDTPGIGSKQSGEGFKKMIEITGIPASSHIYVGNSSKTDILPANNCGMQTIAVWSNVPEANLSINSIYALEEVLL